jgi:hypothetical protein
MAETPFDPAVLFGNAGDMTAELLFERRRPWVESKTQAAVDHGESSRGQREALAGALSPPAAGA